MKNITIKNYYLLGIIILLALVSSSCQASPERQSKPSADWSRSVAAGDFVNGSIGITVDGPGELVHMIWPADLGEGTFLRYVQLNALAEQTISKNLEFPGFLRAPRLTPAGEGQMHLFWASRQAGEKEWAIWHVLLDMTGELRGEPVRISQEDVNVGKFQAIADQNGGTVLCWESGAPGEIYVQHFDQAGAAYDEAVVLAQSGQNPSLWLDETENLYAAWLENGNIIYGRSSLDSLTLSETTVIDYIAAGTGKSLDGPHLGVAGGWVYVFWSVLNQSGLEAGTGFSEYTAFPIDNPTFDDAKRMLISPLEVQPFMAYQGELSLTQLAPPVEEAWASTDYILSPSIQQGKQSGELAVAVAINQDMRLDQHLQIAVVLFREGQFSGYTVGTKTENISDDPALFVDTAMHLHLAWREGAAGNSVYYATTEPGASASLERLTAGDVINAVFQGGMEGLVGITFVPIIGFGWLLPGMLLMVVVKILRDQDNLTRWKYWIPLIIAILVFYFIKLATLPTIAAYVPFSAWVDIPDRFGAGLRILVPLLIIGIAIGVANTVRRRKSQSAILFYITFTLTDALLTLAIYGVNFLGVY